MDDNQSDSLDTLEKALQKELAMSPRDTAGDTDAISNDTRNKVGVLVRLLTAVQEEKDYRQQLLTSDFIDDEEADRVAAAVTEASRYGLSLNPIIDWCAARCSVNNKGGHGKSRAFLGIEGLTHSTFTTLGGDRKDQRKIPKEKPL